MPQGAGALAIGAGATIGSSLIGASGARSAAKSQEKAAQLSAAVQREGLAQFRELTDPFRQAGQSAINPALQLLGISTPDPRAGELQARISELTAQRDSIFGGGTKTKGFAGALNSAISQAKESQSVGINAEIAELQAELDAIPATTDQAGNILDTNVSPESVINNPFFQALSASQDERLIQQRAALGLGGSGGTGDALKRQTLLLGNEFQQQERQNRINEQQQKFNNLLNLVNIGSTAATGAGSAALTTGQNVGQTITAGGRAAAAGTLGATQQIQQGVGDVAGFAIGNQLGLFGGGGVQPTNFTNTNPFNQPPAQLNFQPANFG